jgi:hypothetical protein
MQAARNAHPAAATQEKASLCNSLRIMRLARSEIFLAAHAMIR